MSDEKQQPTYETVVRDLEDLVEKNDWGHPFEQALQRAQSEVIEKGIKTFPQIDPDSPHRIDRPNVHVQQGEAIGHAYPYR